jgi:hypothetical protein
MQLNKTFSDREIRTRLERLAKDLALVSKKFPNGPTAASIRHDICYYEAQLALPRESRCKFAGGSL